MKNIFFTDKRIQWLSKWSEYLLDSLREIQLLEMKGTLLSAQSKISIESKLPQHIKILALIQLRDALSKVQMEWPAFISSLIENMWGTPQEKIETASFPMFKRGNILKLSIDSVSWSKEMTTFLGSKNLHWSSFQRLLSSIDSNETVERIQKEIKDKLITPLSELFGFDESSIYFWISAQDLGELERTLWKGSVTKKQLQQKIK